MSTIDLENPFPCIYVNIDENLHFLNRSLDQRVYEHLKSRKLYIL